MLKRILVPIDGTEYSWRALDYAVALAKMSGGMLIVMTVTKKELLHTVIVNNGDCMLGQIGNEVLDAARCMLRNSGIEAEFRLEEGSSVAEKILRAEKSENCDAIIIGSRGFGMLEGLFKNSVSQLVVENADVPVTIVK